MSYNQDVYQHQRVLESSTVTASGNSGYLPNLSNNAVMTILADVTGAVSGTTPSLTISIGVAATNGGRVAVVQTFTAITAALTAPVRNIISNIAEPFIYIAWTVTGTTPSFGGVNLDMFSY